MSTAPEGPGPIMLGAVLAGGRSRRFGRDKSTEPVDGRAMGARAVSTLRAVCADVVVVSSRPDTPTDWAPVVPDLRPGQGPLAGIEAALHAASERGLEAVFVLATDLPKVSSGLVERVASALPRPDGGAPSAAAAGRRGQPAFEPLCAAYSVSCLPVAADLLDGGERAAQALFAAVHGRVVEPGATHADEAALNVNVPADLERLG